MSWNIIKELKHMTLTQIKVMTVIEEEKETHLRQT